jgi:signal transduction histidine kinase
VNGTRLFGLLELVSSVPHCFENDDVVRLEPFVQTLATSFQNADLQRVAAAAFEGAAQLEERLTIAAHELKNPLSSIDYAIRAYLAEKSESILGRQRSRLMLALSSADEATRIVENLLASYLPPNSNGSNPVSNVAEILEECQAHLQWRAESKGIEVIRSIRNPEDLDVLAEATGLRIIFNNLLSNAIQHTPIQGTIRTSARISGGAVEISFINSGSSVPLKERDRIFEKGYQIVSSISDGFNRLGLGLYVAKQYVLLLGGRIDVQGGDLEASFVVRLPWYQRNVHDAPES